MSAIAWPDIIIGLIVLFGALKGLSRGLVNELAGLIALAFGIAAAFYYGGMWDAWLVRNVHVAPGAAHVVGMVAYGVVAYAIVLVLAGALSAVARLPIIGTANALLGAVVGFAKGAVFAWALLYVALFFPLSADIRHDLHRSTLVAILQRPNDSVDRKVRDSLPGIVRPFGDDLFSRHRV